MGVIVGSGTTVTGFANAISANWGASMNSQRLYVLGKTDPFLVLKKPTQNLSVTCYSAGPSVDVAQSAGCSPATGFSAGVSPGACGGCGGGGSGVTGSWYVTSYSYNKMDPNIPGQESFSMMNYLSPAPSIVLRGPAEGSWTADAGVTGTSEGSSSSGSISAGGIGRADTATVGIATNVGGGSAAVGSTGQASVSVPYTPIYC
jgi:hypothetical protein